MWGIALKFGWLIAPVVVRAVNLGLDYLEHLLKKKVEKDQGDAVAAAILTEQNPVKALSEAKKAFKDFIEYSKPKNPQQ